MLKNIKINDDIYEKCLKLNSKIKNKIKRIHRQNNRVYKLMDTIYHYNLMGIDDSFMDVLHIVFIDKQPWNLETISKHWAHMLCSTDMQSPAPMFPFNPFTKKNISRDDIINYLEYVDKYKIKIYKPLKYILENYDNIINIESYNTNYQLSYEIIDILEEKYRFRLINNKNSQECYNGYWVRKTSQLSEFERLLEYFESVPYQIIDYYGDVHDNPEKIFAQFQLDMFPIEELVIN